jgi:SAM-dependent methyltransferase
MPNPRTSLTSEIAPRLREALAGLPPPRTLLDLGCGDTFYWQGYQSLFPGACCLGLDWAAEAMGHNNYQKIQADARHLPFAQQSVDLILLQHPDLDRNRQSWGQAISEIGRVLATDGHLLAACYHWAEAEILYKWLAEAGFVDRMFVLQAPVPLSGRHRVMLTATPPQNQP